MKHQDSIRTYRITWRMAEESLHAYTDEQHSAECLASGLRISKGTENVLVYSWDKTANGYTETSL